MLANSVDSDQTPRFVASGLHYLPRSKNDARLIWFNVIVSMCLVKKHDGQKPSTKMHAPWKHSLTCVTIGTVKLCFISDFHILMVFQF